MIFLESNLIGFHKKKKALSKTMIILGCNSIIKIINKQRRLVSYANDMTLKFSHKLIILLMWLMD